MSYISAAQAKQIAQKAVNNLKDGTLVPKLAENLTPYAEDSGTTQMQPFFLEGTATGNGESRVDAKQVPAFAFLQEKRGNMVCVNQLLKVRTTSTTENGVTTEPTQNDGELHIYGTSNGLVGTAVLVQTITLLADHTYLFFGGLEMGQDCSFIIFSTGTYFNIPRIYTPIVNIVNTQLSIRIVAGITLDKTVRPKLIDLTQWFNGNIPAYLLSHPEAFGRYYKGSLAYEPGRHEPATGRYLTSVGRNIWDETWRNGYYDTQSGAYVYQASSICSEGNIKVNPNTPYCLYSGTTVGYFNVFEFDSNGAYIGLRQPANGASFVTSANCQSITFGMPGAYGTTYNDDITISFYYSGESGYDKYYPHEVLATIDTGTESLYSAGSAYDSKVPSGLITRRIGSVDLGTLTWTYSDIGGGVNAFYTTGISQSIKRGSNILNLRCSRYITTSQTGLYTDGDKIIATNTLGNIYIIDSTYTDAASFKAAMSGVMLYYELAESTTEQGTPFQENIPIDDFGQLSWSNTSVPQGNQIFYPVDYKAYEDTLIKYTDGDATSLVRKTDYASSSKAGVVKANPIYGFATDPTGTAYVNQANENDYKVASTGYRPVTPQRQHQSVFYGLSRAAGVNLASSTEETAPNGTNPGVYPATAIQSILKMLLPAAPTTDGTYDLVCTVTNGEPTFSWVART